jgi:hypothetical protein
MNAPASKSQTRLLKLINATVSDDYATNAITLEKAGFIASGIPAEHTWRSVAKLSDSDLLAAAQNDEYVGFNALNVQENNF